MHCTNGLVREGHTISGRHRHIGVMEGYPIRVSSKSGIDGRCRKGKDKHLIRTLNKIQQLKYNVWLKTNLSIQNPVEKYKNTLFCKGA